LIGTKIMGDKRIKICCVANTDAFVKFLLLSQLKFLVNEGYDVYVACTQGKWSEDIKKEGIKIKNIKIKRRISPLYDLVTLCRLWSYFKKEKFDIVHTNNPKPGLLGQLAAKMAGIPVIINTIHGLYFGDNHKFFKRRFFIFIEKIAAKFSDSIFSVNKEDIETLEKERIAPPEKIRYLGNGVNLMKFDSDRFSEELVNEKKKSFGIPAGHRVLGIVARLVREKGYLDLFEALKLSIKVFPDITLLSVGPEEPGKKDALDFKTINDYGLQKNVIFLGERDDVDQIYPLMDIFVFPSHREGLPVSVLEAMSEKKPIVASDIRGCREEIENKENGILVPARNPQKLSEAIIFLLSNPQEMKKIAENARADALKYFDEKLVFERIRATYADLIGRK